MKTDIKNQKWIEKLPESWRPYVLLGRFDRPVGIWLLLLPGWWSIALAAPWGGSGLLSVFYLFVLFGVGAVVMRAAGCVMNDVWDRKIDQKVERTKIRPLAAGALSVRAAVIFLFVLLLIGLMILLQMNMMTIVLGVSSLPFIAIYPYMKRITWWPQAFLGLTFNFGALMGWSAVAGHLSVSAVLLYVGGFFWTIGYDTIYAHQDKEDDVLIGVKSTALKFGDNSKDLVSACYSLVVVCMCVAVFVRTNEWFDFLFMLPAFAHLVWQVRVWNMGSQDNCLTVFKSNRDFGLLVFLSIVLAQLF